MAKPYSFRLKDESAISANEKYPWFKPWFVEGPKGYYREFRSRDEAALATEQLNEGRQIPSQFSSPYQLMHQGHHRGRHHAAKKTPPAQLQREIDEVLATPLDDVVRHGDRWISRKEAAARAAFDPKRYERAVAEGRVPAAVATRIAKAEAARRPSGKKVSHATRGGAESTPRLLARWESRSGKHWVELTQHAGVTIANAMDPTSVGGRDFTWYGYTSPSSSGTLAASTNAAAIAEMEQRVNRGDFLPDAAKTPMKRVR